MIFKGCGFASALPGPCEEAYENPHPCNNGNGAAPFEFFGDA